METTLPQQVPLNSPEKPVAQSRWSKPFLIILGILIVALVATSAWYFVVSPKTAPKPEDKVLATVAGKKIRESDLRAYDLIFNAEAKYQQKFSTKSAALASREKVLASLIRVTKIEIAAQKEGVTISDQDIASEIKTAGGKDKITANVKRYGWSFADWKRSREIALREQKLIDKVLVWRLGELVAVRWDVIPKKVGGALISVYQEKSKAALNKIEAGFKTGEDVDKLALSLREDPSVLSDFTANAIQSLKVSSDPTIRFIQRVTPSEKNEDWQEHVLGLGSKVQSELWCSEAACYLTRVVGGNDSQYKSLEEYLNAKVK